jgi:tetratricopeptide (TPR) repeat protein
MSVVSMLWSDGVFKFDYHKQLDTIQTSINTLKVSQQGFEKRTFGTLDPMASAITSIDTNVQELLFRNVHAAPRSTTFERGHLVIPFVRNGNFVGRRTIIESVERKLNVPASNNRVALRGLGGVGKSQIALELAYRAQNSTPTMSCFWVSAVSRNTFTRSYRQIASTLAIPGTSNPSNNMLQLVKDYLQKEKAGPWLMMVDNIDDLRSLRGEIDETDSSDLLDYLPQCTHGRLLFTTRSKEAALALTGTGAIVEVPAMDANEAQKLLRGKLDDDNDEAVKQDCLDLVMALEYLPLPISHAASYIREMDSTPAKYLRMFNDDQKRTKLLKHRYDDLARDGEQNNTVLTTWGISFKQIQRDSPESADLLRIMGSLHWQDIPQYLLQQEKLEDEDDFDEAVAPLLAFSLIQKAPKLETFSMHRLVNIAIRSWSESREWARTAQRLLVQVFPILRANQISGEKNLKCRQLLQHAQKVSDSLDIPCSGDTPISADAFSPMAVKLKFRIASYLFVSWQLQEARNLFEKLVVPVDAFTQQGTDVGISAAELEDKITGIYFSQCLEFDGVNRAKRAYESRKRTLPANHPDTLRAIDLFSLALICQGKLQEAETVLKEAYALVPERPSKSDMLGITLLLSLSAVYAAMGKYQMAVDTYQKVLDTLVPLYGEKNDCVIRCLGAMADSLYNLNIPDQARVLIRKALALSEETLGPDHPVTLGVVARLAAQLFTEDRPAAFKLRERVWKGHRRLYGDDLNITLMSLSLYATSHPSPVESERLLKEAIERARKIAGGRMSGVLLALEDALADFYGAGTMDANGNDGVYSHGEAANFCRMLVDVSRCFEDYVYSSPRADF